VFETHRRLDVFLVIVVSRGVIPGVIEEPHREGLDPLKLLSHEKNINEL
jgi:hypothetical protein